MEKKVIDLRDLKEDAVVYLPKNYKVATDTDTVYVEVNKDPYEPVPKSWIELFNKYRSFDSVPKDDNNVGIYDEVSFSKSRLYDFLREKFFLNEEDAEAFLALVQLRRLWHEWVEVLGKPLTTKNYCIRYTLGKYNENGYPMFKDNAFGEEGSFRFLEREHAKKYFEHFKELFEKAKILL